MAYSRIKTLLAEPSLIIRSGIISLLENLKNLSFEITETTNFDDLQKDLNNNKFELLIINPAFLGHNPKLSSNHKKPLKIIAIQTSLLEKSFLKNYNTTISLYDSFSQIQDKLENIIKQDNNEEKMQLSSREREIIALIAKGLSNKEIADKLFLSTHTVTTHRRNIMSKLEIHSPAGLTIYAIVNKIVDISEVE